MIGLPSSGLHSNGYTLARSALGEHRRWTTSASAARSATCCCEPTEIYVKPIVELLRSEVDVRGLAHITSGGLDNLLRLEAEVGYEIDDPLPVPPIFAPDPGARRGHATRRCTRSSTWAAASAWSWRPRTRTRR